ILCGNGLYIAFERADQIAARMDRLPDDARRIEAGLLYVLRHNLGNGHTCLPADKLVPTAAGLLGVEPRAVSEQLENMIAVFTVKTRPMNGKLFVFLPALYNAETYIAGRMSLSPDCRTLPPDYLDGRIAAMERAGGIAYAERQKDAIRQAVNTGMLILTGGPGTGKTTTLRAIISLLEEMGETVAVAAPTGRAAKRLSELTGADARTIHRLLEVQWTDDDASVFARNEQNPLDADALVLDEMSMVDVPLMEGVLRALKTNARLIMVGDTDQLPAVGPGSVLHDLIGSGAVPVVQLTEIFRQAMESRIVTNAHRIVRGEMPDLTGHDGDFFFMPRPGADQVAQTVMDLCVRRLPATYGLTAFQGIQVLCPGRQGELGTVALNRQLQELLNPPAADKRTVELEGARLRVGDKVMHIRNNYDIPWTRDSGEDGSGVFNGDIGVLEEIDRHGETLTVRYDDRLAQYTRQDARDLQLAYAVTVHKSQGSEFDAVILPLFHQQKLLCYRNLLYTAVTRAKKLLIIVGSAQTVEEMVQNDRKTLRYTGLGTFIAALREARG
ncbi:MAG: ATP-dependent DNA helicase, partial [Acutalibacteraceae bacterium]